MLSEAPKCQHVRSNGTRCGSPALKDNMFCYYHQHCRPVTFQYNKCIANYSDSDVTLPVFDDPHGIQITLHRVTELVLRHQIDQKDASLVLYALQLAMWNLKRVERDQPKPEDVVTDPPLEAAGETDPTDNVDGDADEEDDNGPPPGTIHACIDSAESNLSGSALSPNVRLRWANRSRFPGAKTKLAPN